MGMVKDVLFVVYTERKYSFDTCYGKSIFFCIRIITNSCGKHMHGSLISRVVGICYEQYGDCNWPKIPEECFAKAYEEVVLETKDFWVVRLKRYVPGFERTDKE